MLPHQTPVTVVGKLQQSAWRSRSLAIFEMVVAAPARILDEGIQPKGSLAELIGITNMTLSLLVLGTWHRTFRTFWNTLFRSLGQH